MPKTIFEQQNAAFSDLAHESALNDIYPKIFKSRFSCESTSLYKSREYEFLDGEKKIDRIFRFQTSSGSDLKITVQERFRRPEFYRYRDITLTEYNFNSGINSEVYEIEAMYFLYAYYNPKTRRFGEIILINVADLILALVNKRIAFTRKFNKKNQSFLIFKFEDLIKSKVVKFHNKPY